MSKYVLETNYDYEFSILAISSSEPDYKLCIHLNRALGIGLSRREPLDVKAKNTRLPLVFSCFIHEEEDNEDQLILLGNRSMNAMTAHAEDMKPTLFEEDPGNDVKGFLIPELPKADYLLLIKSEEHLKRAEEIHAELKKINFVRMVQAINPLTLASKKNLII
jgi:hypothetical protein